MNGMTGKDLRRKLNQLMTREGLPMDAKHWTEADWKDLHFAVNLAIRAIAARHKECPHCGPHCELKGT